MTNQHPSQPTFNDPDMARHRAFRELCEHIRQYTPLDDKDCALLEQLLRWEIKTKGSFLLQPGQVCDQVRFLISGAVIFYEHLDEELQLEQVTWIARPTEMVMEINSFFQRQPTRQFLKCTVPCEFLTLSYDDLQMLYAAGPTWNTVGRRLTESLLLLMAERTYVHQLNSAKEKYLYFLERFPEAAQLVSQRHIAAFLKIRPETLSRLRSKQAESARHIIS